MTAAQVTQIEKLTQQLSEAKAEIDAAKATESAPAQAWCNLETKLRLPSDLNDLTPSEYNGNKSIKFQATPLVWNKQTKGYQEGRSYYFEATDNGFGALATEVESRIKEGRLDIVVRARYESWVYTRDSEEITCDKWKVVTIQDIPVSKYVKQETV